MTAPENKHDHAKTTDAKTKHGHRETKRDHPKKVDRTTKKK